MNSRLHPLPAETVSSEKVLGHWLLARLGKRVLRPGGLEMTRKMIQALAIQPGDKVVEFAPGLDITAKLALLCKPAQYTAIERDPIAAEQVRQYLQGELITASAHETGLADHCATVVYGEAVLSMHPERRKREIIQEAARLLSVAGNYAIHELCLVNVTPELQETIHDELCQALRVNATPLTQEQWEYLLTQAGFNIEKVETAPMALLEPMRILTDEGLLRSVRFFCRLFSDEQARTRVGQMRKIFQKYRNHMAAIVIIAEKQAITNKKQQGAV